MIIPVMLSRGSSNFSARYLCPASGQLHKHDGVLTQDGVGMMLACNNTVNHNLSCYIARVCISQCRLELSSERLLCASCGLSLISEKDHTWSPLKSVLVIVEFRIGIPVELSATLAVRPSL